MTEKERLDYLYLYSTMVYDREGIKPKIDLIRQGTNAYKKAEALTGVPWYVIGITHYKECSCDFTRHLHNGDPLKYRTTRVPAGRPKTGSPPFDWFYSAQDALALKPNKDWSLEGTLYWSEGYNGFGYRNRNVDNPYLWSKTQYYKKGLYIRDHVYDEDAVFTGYGFACFLKELREEKVITQTKKESTSWKELIDKLKKALSALRENSMNENYFSVPTVENSYWAGFIATDGCIRQDKGSTKKNLVLQLKDEEPVKNLHKKLNLSNKIYYYKPNKSYRLECYSDKICKDLNENWNITQRKTETLLPPKIEREELIKSFLIGVIDGDGNIGWNKSNKTFRLRITGKSILFLNWCNEQLAKFSNIEKSPSLIKNNSAFDISYSAKKAREIFKALKDIDVPRLDRKWSKIYGKSVC